MFGNYMKAILQKKTTAYVLGLALSLTLTLLAFGLVESHILTGHLFPTHEVARFWLVIFAVIQLGVQLELFMHLGDEPKPRWNMLALSFAVIVVTIIVGGTLWIMSNLSHMQQSSGFPFIGTSVTPQSEDD